jgi:hypothetical protein
MGQRDVRADDPRVIRGRQFRYLLTTLLKEARRPLTVAELVVLCEAEGVVFAGRPSKIVSDALRWEIGWRRVTRVSRGVYRFLRAPRSTTQWIRRRVTELRDYLAATRAGTAVPFPWPTSLYAPTIA